MTRWWVEKIFRYQIFKSQNCILPGRWQRKNDPENWMLYYYPDPGYTNTHKTNQNSKKSKS